MASRGGGSGGAMMRAAEIDKMSVEQLKALKEQADLEVNLLQDSLNNIRTATARLDIASTSLHDLSLRPQGKKMLVPLTASLYVPGTLDDADKVLVDVGTGYFIEKTMAEGKDYCERKINLLKSNYDQLVEELSTIFCDHVVNDDKVSKNHGSKLNQITFLLLVWFGSKFHSGWVNRTKPNHAYPLLRKVATKKKNIADEVGVILQAKLKQLAPTP
ncbi:unnamed protein product [Camellia sinensis]